MTLLQTTAPPLEGAIEPPAWPLDGDLEPGTRRNLVLIASRRMPSQTGDFQELVRMIRRRAPDVAAVFVRDRAYNRYRPRWFLRPSLVVCPTNLGRLRPPRGTVRHGVWQPKSQEYEALEKLGVPVPRWRLVTPHGPPDLSGFPHYVVVKPDQGAKGAEVKIIRAHRVRYKPPENRFAREQGQLNLLVQEFIYTGRWAVSYRVTTLFGKALFCWKAEANRQHRPLDGPQAFRGPAENGGGITICSSGGGCTIRLCFDPDVITLAERAHRAFPSVPLLGVDILREEPTGRLFVIEVNSSGGVWHFSSKRGRGIQRDNGIDLKAQFGAFEIATDVLIQAARRLAN